MKKIILTAVAGLLAAQASYAQIASSVTPANRAAPAAVIPPEKGKGKIFGTVQDASAKTPLEFATVALESEATGKIVDGSITDAKGQFSIAGVALGRYKLKVSFLGYDTQFIENVTVASEKEEVYVGVVALRSSANALGEVTVVGDKPLIEDKVDRVVYNAEKDIDPGAAATDVMRKVPGLSVDLEGNVQLRGSSNIQVLINNKPSAVMASSIADALQQIPADQIKAVEVITSPSAKYDAEGTAGIINIITKKDGGLQGLTGNISATYGTLTSNANSNLNYRRGKIGLNTALGYTLSDIRGENIIESVYGAGSNLTSLSQKLGGNREVSSTFLQFGASYDFSKTSYIAAGVRLVNPDVTFRTTQVSTSSFADASHSRNTREGSNHFSGNNYDVNLDYTKSFEKRGQELSVLGLLSRNTRNNEILMKLSEDKELVQREQSFNDAFNEEATLQSDYTHPVNESQVVEAGAKAIWRYAESDYRFMLAQPASSPFVPQPGRTDVFSYHQKVLASYAAYGLKLNKYNMKVGLRYEHTSIDGDFTSSGTQVEQDYHSFFPSLSVSKSLQKDRTLKFNYSRRIQRPQLSYLNPYENLSNPRNVIRGNPTLEAELTDSYEIGYSAFLKSGASVNASLYWYKTSNAIQQVSTPYDGTDPDSVGRVTTTVANVGENNSYGLSLSASTKLWEKGRVSSNMNLFYSDFRGEGRKMANSGLVYNTNLNASYSFSKGITAQVAGEYNSPQITLQGKIMALLNYSIAVRKEVLNKKGSIGTAVSNPFNKYVERERVVNSYNKENALVLSQSNTWHYYFRQVRLSFSYKFGKQDAKTRTRPTKKVNNEDVKENDDNAMQ
ncbi:outer membrane receptor for ferrienterochelin and colicin [Pontibacter ummariensis]|uniref:Outer membrane receptor for ferrienterochelin and colicins n=1 Tax=Pontibacter ummariensis TaxID=1610492 RepID=A0A239L773_9BACT|nr:outer membrane beta-barrel family protein [Pontibacter ummariensis]PRY04291.1 outer membrane receptor for ferrienterochelin and colicin [Pontibacter ummariensis]SNT25852.1 Outer membrane receptor for ferrienterochelin and colicins [Pontibacter ummariensis]